jgi:hypothetical protein
MARSLRRSAVQSALLGLALIGFEPSLVALAQQGPALVPEPHVHPRVQSPLIAPVPLIPQVPKIGETKTDWRSKIETSAPTKTRRAAVSAAAGPYDVGVIPGSTCPSGSERITIRMDDEDNQNANSSSGWIGAIVSNNNTTFVFCRVDGAQFLPMEAPYAVLQLAAQCPPYSFPFTRYFDNEDSQNINTSTGNIWPNWTSWANSDTQLNFCLFGAFSWGGWGFPDLGMEYGVFASNLPNSGLANGHLYTDDEDQSNQNAFDTDYYNLGTSASQIIWGDNGDRNTHFALVKVKNAPPPPPHCAPKVVYYNNSLLTPYWDNANCYIKPVAAGATPFIWNNNYYVVPDRSTTCLPGTGTWDTVNCLFMPKPPGGFLYNDGFYVPAGAGNTCTLGVFNSVDCVIKEAPWGTHAFEYQNNWYFTTLFTCRDGAYDGANCYVMKAPAGKVAFIFMNNFYYQD